MRGIRSGDIARFERMAVGGLDGAFTARDFELYDGGTISARCCISMRRAQAMDLTGAAQQETRVCTILADEWDAASPGRPPRKGDEVIVSATERYAIDRVHRSNFGDNSIIFRAFLKG